jgi:hypothetical protein
MLTLKALLEDLGSRLAAAELALGRLERGLRDPEEVWRLQAVVFRGLAGYCGRRSLGEDDEDEDIFDPGPAGGGCGPPGSRVLPAGRARGARQGGRAPFPCAQAAHLAPGPFGYFGAG